MNIQQLQDRLSNVESFLLKQHNVKTLEPPPSPKEAMHVRNEKEKQIQSLQHQLAELQGDTQPLPSPNNPRQLTWWQKQQRGINTTSPKLSTVEAQENWGENQGEQPPRFESKLTWWQQQERARQDDSVNRSQDAPGKLTWWQKQQRGLA